MVEAVCLGRKVSVHLGEGKVWIVGLYCLYMTGLNALKKY